ncbi:alpha/beta hydrolase [Variovorax sp. WS11]|uniref:alpha/beta fold hydrolase n=1 Tax=Variovorax sp. WS11 TaxID=1105204 RepID=UPI000D0DD36A|nr:alpha/beta hydrolase [Variovorax sp. WS11]NDZ17635.1 alpha/beta hydrolase [Variovorax sp. WS11]PSL79581.1 alpha/beta hydrolase [Variovorax sp. WS11]
MLGYTSIGQGPIRILAAHTWLCDHQTYAPMMPFVDPDKFTVVLPDFRGYGKSRDQKGEFTVREMGSDLLELAEQLDWREFHLVGNSMGGQAAQWAVFQKAAFEKVRSLTLLCSVPAQGFPLDEQGAAFFGSAADDVEVRGQCAAAVTSGRLGAGFARHVAKLSLGTATTDAIRRYLNAWTQEDVSAEARDFKGVVNVFVGAHDPVLTEAVMREKVLPLFPQATLATIEGAGHYPALEAPARTAELICAGASQAQ